MKKTINVDELLDRDALELVVAGKKFVIHDIDVETLISISQARGAENPWDEVRANVVNILGPEAKGLKLGVRQLRKIFDEIISFATEDQEPNPSIDESE